MTERAKVLKINFQDHETFRYVRTGIGQYIQESLEKMPECQGFLFEAAVNEAVNNAINHGCAKVEDKQVSIKLEVYRQKKLIIRVKDNGPGFPGNAKLKELNKLGDEPTCNQADNLFLESGRGLFLMKSVADEIRFNKKGNEVMLVKALP